QGHVALQGRYATATQTVEGRADVARLNPADLYSTLDAAPLQGRVEATTREDQSVAFTAALQADSQRARRTAGKRAPLALERLNVQGEWQAPWLRLTDLRLDALQARVRSSRVEVETQTMQVTARAQAEVPGAKLDIDGQLGRETGKGQADLAIASAPALLQWVRGLPGVGDPLAGANLEGQGQLALQWQGGWGKLLQRLQASAGQLPTTPTGLQLQANLDVPSLRYLSAGADPLAVQGLKLTLKGTPEQAQLDLQGKAQMGERKLQLNTALAGGLSSLRSGAANDWQARIERLQASAELGKEFPGTWAVQLQSPLTLRQTSPGQTVRSTQFDAGASALIVTPPSLFEGQSRIEWQEITARSQPKGSWAIKTQGKLLGVPMAWIDALGVQGQEGPLTRAGISGDLKLNGDWNIDTTGPQLQASATLERAAGDIRIAIDEGNTSTIVRSSGPSASSNSGDTKSTARAVTVQGARMRARIQQARLNVKAQGDDVVAQLDWASERAGNVKAQLGTRLARSEDGWAWPEDAPLSGKVSAQMPDVGIWSLFAPPGWRASGTFSADATLSGSRLDPRWQGTLQASRLGIASLLDGVDLKNGSLNGSFAGNQLNITQLRFEGGQGSSARILGYSGNLTAAPASGGEIVGQGSIRWDKQGEGDGSGLRMQFNAEARKLQVLVRADRQLSVSGNLQAQLDQGLWTLRGKLTADRAAILLPEDSAPSLDSDVVVRSAASRKAQHEAQARQTSAKAETAKPPDIAVTLDLGNDFALQGFGITTRLIGQLDVLGPVQAGGPPRITGEVRTEQGRYRAWGQSLDVETGIVRFNGSYDNPSLDILAIRPNITVRAGVQVTGSATDPRVRLYSDPEMPDAEKLSWVVMGRDPSEGGAEAALLQQAALALLSGGGSGENFAGRVGLDEIGFKGPGSGDSSDGAALTLGKRLSTNLYITYEQSLSGAMGTLYVFYDLSRRLTLRGQTGEKSAVDLIYTVRKD
ncbi:translocation/assembly module TamB domain-containing protein, partial [Acidovorax sp. CCYZU-2555]|uniref:translocation/assembly module TamB domain-containing protein n=1 Tax=Acidovorax sp. CCYZU-2555 TaxID=2835042 RepID=UPI001BD10ADA